MKNVYKITNIINGRMYIGQSKNPEKRFLSHMRKRSSSKSLSEDVDKYGKDSFVLDILEEDIKDINKEKEWIRHYIEQGYELYNKTKGGEEPPTLYGEDNPFCVYTEKQVEETIYLLKSTSYDYDKISNIVNSSKRFVKEINKGARKLDGVEYPIRKDNHFEYISKLIKQDLINTDITQKEIAKKYGVARSMVTMINIGENRKEDGIDYPIRKSNSLISKKDRKFIEESLLKGVEPHKIIKTCGHYTYVYRLHSKMKKGGLI